MLTIGDKFPSFSLKAVSSAVLPAEFDVITDERFDGQWKVFYFWPKDFTFVCPTEIIGFDDLNDKFAERNAKLIGVSTDSDFVHLAWRQNDAQLANIKHPWLADIKKDLSNALGIVQQDEGVAYRATFIVDPEGIIRHVSVNDLSVGRNPKEVLRTLDALQTDELCPCAWNQGEKTLNAA